MTSVTAVPDWKSVRSLADLGELTARWLEGDVPEVPSYGGPPDDETLPLVPVLAALNRAGYVTTCSQPGEAGSGYEGALWEQRAAVEGLATPSMVLPIIIAAASAGLMVIAHDPARLPRRRVRWDRAVPVTIRDGEPYTWFGAQVPRRDPRDRATGYGACHPAAVTAICPAWQITVIDPEWGRGALLWETLASIRKDAA